MAEHERRFHGEADRLRSPERIDRFEIDRVVALATEGLKVSRVLDIGTGTGVFAQAFAATGISAVGIDTNPDLLELARKIVPGVQFDEAPAEAIPYADGTFDIAFLGLVLHETDDPVRALAEARRVSTMRVVVLEWPYRQEEHGPPLAHRLQPKTIVDMGELAGFGRVEQAGLTHMDLYRLSLEPETAR